MSDCNSAFVHVNEQTQDMCVGAHKHARWDGALCLELPKLKELRSMVYKIRFQHTHTHTHTHTHIVSHIVLRKWPSTRGI